MDNAAIMNDTELWLAVQKDDYTAFEKLFHKYYSPLCRYAEGFVGNRHQAEDVVQDMFTYFWENRLTIEVKISVTSCFYIAVRHRSLRILQNEVRLQRHYPKLSEYIVDLMDSEYHEDDEAIEKVRSVMQQLPPQCLKIFVMSVLEEKKYMEIANELGISINTVKTHMTKAYRVIRQQIPNNPSQSLLLLLSCIERIGFFSGKV